MMHSDQMRKCAIAEFLTYVHTYHLEAEHLPGRDNILADDLSCDRHLSFLSKAPDMRRDPAVVPPLLPAVLLLMSDTNSFSATRARKLTW